MGSVAVLTDQIGVLTGQLGELEEARNRSYTDAVNIAASFLQQWQKASRLAEVVASNLVEAARDANKLTLGSRFTQVSIAEATRILLEENGTMHGREIQRELMLGGIDTSSENFQAVLSVTLRRRLGEFAKVGRNIWGLAAPGQAQV